MAEYIEREAVKTAIRKQFQDLADRVEILTVVNMISTADVWPVVRGKWIVKTDADGKTYGVCSECGYEQYAGHLKFCPNCGADMREEI